MRDIHCIAAQQCVIGVFSQNRRVTFSPSILDAHLCIDKRTDKSDLHHPPQSGVDIAYGTIALGDIRQINVFHRKADGSTMAASFDGVELQGRRVLRGRHVDALKVFLLNGRMFVR